MWPYGLLPLVLAFESLSTVPIINKNFAAQKNWMETLQKEGTEVENICVEQHVNVVVWSKLPTTEWYKFRSSGLINAHSVTWKMWISRLKVFDFQRRNLCIDKDTRTFKIEILQVAIKLKEGKKLNDVSTLFKLLSRFKMCKTCGVLKMEVLSLHDRWY